MFNRRFLQLVAAGLLLLFPATLFAAAFQISGTGSRRAIDTLTVEDGSGAFGKIAGNVDTVIFETDSLASATATRNRVVFEGEQQLDCKLFRIQELGSDRVQINATGGRIIASIKLNGQEVNIIGATSHADQNFVSNDLGQNPPLPACGPVPSVSFYGLIVLALLLAGVVVWFFRRHAISKGNLA